MKTQRYNQFHIKGLSYICERRFTEVIELSAKTCSTANHLFGNAVEENCLSGELCGGLAITTLFRLLGKMVTGVLSRHLAECLTLFHSDV